jgi:hypothetical protein
VVCFDGVRRVLTERGNCERMWSDNITIDTIGHISIELSD